MIAVVTGGSGFLGRNLVERLQRDGHLVRCLVRPNGSAPPAGTERHVVDYANPRSLLGTSALDGADAVFHLAGVTRTARPDGFLEGNVMPTRHLLGAIAARRLRPRFVYVSSQAASGPAPDVRRPVLEDDVPRPVEAYGRSKYEAERVVAGFLDRIPVTVVRPCSVFGPRDRDFLQLFRLAQHGLLIYPSRGEHWLSVLHVDELVEGLLNACLSPAAIGRTYFLARDEPVTWRGLGRLVVTAVGRSRAREIALPDALVSGVSRVAEWMARVADRRPLASRSRAVLARQRYWVCSAERARRELGWREQRSLPDAVRETYYWYRDHGWLRPGRTPATSVS